MLKQELDKRMALPAIAATLVITLIGGVTYSSYRNKKQVEEVVAQRMWQQNREMGLPLSMEPDKNASPEERKAARTFAMEQQQWGGKSVVEADPNATATPGAPDTTGSPSAPELPAAPEAPAAPIAPASPVSTVSAPPATASALPVPVPATAP